ncbi:integrin alpha-M isoform X3 [Eptesicus fuscus]|uniref:integrin alpha-M isoform X3 n=1 Tax=Eptesicus fuscus TaxID=29078 RepID=UPI0024048DD1|nr:integrin alpha-M isoform X3 [Eptesicus fuscus]
MPTVTGCLLSPAMTDRVLLLTALALCHGFNLDTENPVIFRENARSFGQSVVQLEGSRVVVGAPQEIKTPNQTGGLYQCDYSTSACEPIQLQVPPEAVNMSLGLSLAFATNPFRLLACGPTLHQMCKENTYVNGFCFLFGSNLRQPPQRFPKALRECPQQESDIAFLIDGSGSINQNDFLRMKDFVSTVMNQFTKSKTLFSLMQYSDEFRTHFTFQDFKANPDPRLLVRPIEQLKGWTHTATGIRKVVRELFDSKSGARKNALKILVVITDGKKYGDPLGYENVIAEADREGIIRYVIGVGSAFDNRKSREELETIASKPSHDHVFQVTNFEALKTIQNQLQEKIFAIEGTQTGSTSSFEYEMSQEGFSASITSNGPLLGAVGSFDWSGGAFLHMSEDKVAFINMTRINSDMNDAYLGYAAEVVSWGQVQTLALGAPRYQHTGLVAMFRQSAGAWEVNAMIEGSQRIAGSQLSPTLQYFGQSLSGGQDLTMDGLMDLAVGAQGQALLLRSQPVLRVEATMIFTPRELARSVFECRENVVRGLTAGEVRVCLRVQKRTGDRLRPGEIQSTVTYDLALDSTRSRPRAILEETKNNTRRQTRVLGLSQTCETLKLQLPECVEDSVTPVVLRLNFSLEGQPLTSYGNLRPVLAVDAPTVFTASLPFEKNCGNDSVCQDALSVSFSFRNLHTLVVGGPRNFNVTVTVRNQGEDSFNTRVAFFYPPGLSYRMVSGVQSQHSWRSWRVNCDSDPSTQTSTLHSGSCSINHPIFPGNSEVTFNITLDVDSDASLGDRLLLKANVTSENNSPRTNQTEFQLALPVKYAVYMVVSSREGSVKYLSFPASKKTSHVINHQYQFTNLGQRSPRIGVVLWIPIRLNEVPVWGDPDAVFSPNLNRTCRREERVPPRSGFLAELSKAPVLNCSVAVCLRVQCDFAESFGSREEFSVNLTGSLSFDWYIQTPHNHLQVVSTAEILLDDRRFAQLPGQEALVRAQTETKVEPYEVHDPVPLIVGSSVGGLVLLGLITAAMYKLGFFKRQYKDMMNEAAPEAAPPQ